MVDRMRTWVGLISDERKGWPTCPMGLLVAMWLVAPLFAQSARPGMERLAIEVELTCPSCAQGLERRLGRLAGVAQVQIDSEEGQVVLIPAPGGVVGIAAARDVIRNAGFIPENITLDLLGTVVHRDGTTALAVSDQFLITLAAGPETEAIGAQHVGQMVFVTGRMTESDEGQALEVDAVEFR